MKEEKNFNQQEGIGGENHPNILGNQNSSIANVFGDNPNETNNSSFGKVSAEEFQEIVEQAKYFLENPNESPAGDNILEKYPDLYKAIYEEEKQRQEELAIVVKEKSVKINENNFDLEIFGTPAGFSAATNKNTFEDANYFYRGFYGGDSNDYQKSIKKFFLVRKPFSKEYDESKREYERTIYIYRRGRLIESIGRPYSFFAMSIELDKIYCTDFVKLERLLDQIFDKIIVEKYGILRKTENPYFPYAFEDGLDSFDKKKIKLMIKEIKTILLKNFQGALADDFRKVDENFEKTIKKHEWYRLHQISYAEDLEPGDFLKKKTTDTLNYQYFNTNAFDFDRNPINTKYNERLSALKKQFVKEEIIPVAEPISEEIANVAETIENTDQVETPDKTAVNKEVKESSTEKISSKTFQEIVEQIRHSLEEPDENQTTESRGNTYPDLYKAVYEIEKKRQSKLDIINKEKAVEINENNFDLELVGAPQIFDTTASYRKDKIKDILFYQMFYDGNKADKSLSLLRKNSDKIIYMYTRNHLLSETDRTGSFFGISIELDNIYCTDFEKLERFLDVIFDKIIVEKYHILEKTSNPKLPYRFKIKDFKDERGQQAVVELKDIILKNFKNNFAEDFRKRDETFNKIVEESSLSTSLILHRVTNGREDVKIPDSRYFDFDRKDINAEYEEELSALKAKFEVEEAIPEVQEIQIEEPTSITIASTEIKPEAQEKTVSLPKRRRRKLW